MVVENLKTEIPNNILQFLLSYVPLGSEYVVFCSSDSPLTYDLIYNNMVTNDLRHFQVVDDVVTELDLNDTYSGWEVSFPTFAYSNSVGSGIRHDLPVCGETNSVLLMVICCLCILKVVFGGVRLWSDRRKS